ncbi:Predicted amidohydrolase YtcJ [Geodermatophilus amargosae]|uniref:Predicted amidohydrolase YtcJ n=1 Tax=Geodermatophilus amargosae TaxID=1296565 RepID=A0A1I7B4Q5_9ACTN|nr:amidohydrolase family protein [Geodermatophilus amargosae]SFT82131.1 Predicted amidohydrolase YtcJ [Geodermatophilus amargosae]
MSGLLVHDAEVDGVRGAAVRIGAGRVTEVGAGLRELPGEEVLDAAGGALLPGLHDAHLHLHALAAADRSVACGPPAVTDPEQLATALAAAPAAGGWVRGIGYVESVAGDLDAAALDRLHGARPVRVQQRSGALWTVNSRGAEILGLVAAVHPGVERDGRGVPTGRLWRADDWLRSRLPRSAPPDLAAVGARLARLGITSVTDATPDLDDAALSAIADAVARGVLPPRVEVLGVPLGRREVLPGLVAGPYKIVLADSGLPSLGDLVDRIRAAHDAGRSVAVHCVTREALVLLLVALGITGVRLGDRVEHAALVPVELLDELAATGLRVVTQPGFLSARGDDYLRDVPAIDHADLYRCASILAAGVPLALSSDAPYGPLDPWAVMTAAVHRRTASGAVVGAAETLTPAQALAGYLGSPGNPGGAPRRVRVGSTADLVVLDRTLTDVLHAPTSDAVQGTLVGGRVVFAR